MPRKSDVTAVARIFESEHESAEAAASAAIEALDAARRDRMGYAVAVNGRPLPHVYTGFENREDCKRWCNRVGLDVAALDVWVIPVWSRDVVLARHQVMTEEIEAKNRPQVMAPRRKSVKRAA